MKTSATLRSERQTTARARTLGACIWLTGLSGAGKSTIAKAVAARLRDHGHRVTVLDGDQIRASISADLGFSAVDRDANVLRVAALAKETVARGHVAICALVSPYRRARGLAFQQIGTDGVVEVFVDTPLSVCQSRDPKGLYARAARGEVKGLTGVDDPYEAPESPDVVVDTVGSTIEECATQVFTALGARGLIDRLDTAA